MRRISFIITILGIFILLILLNTNPIKVNSLEDLENLQENQKVTTSSKVISERPYGNAKLLTLENKIELICSCPSYLNKNITALGILNVFNKKRIAVLEITPQL